MNDFFTVEMDDTQGQGIKVTFRKSRIDAVQLYGKCVTVLISGHQPKSFNLPDTVQAKRFYSQIGLELEAK